MEGFDNLFGEGSGDNATVFSLDPTSAEKYATIGLYYVATQKVQQLQAELDRLKIKIMGIKDTLNLEDLGELVDIGLTLEERLTQTKQEANGLYIRIKEQGWL